MAQPLKVPELLAAAWPPQAWADVTVLVAVSGGADSVALLHGLVALKSAGEGRLVVGHVNHRLREDAEADERFVAELSGRLGLECCSTQLTPRSLSAMGDGLEAAAREARYRFLRTTAERLGARYIACGHTADDQIETVLHRILRGTGIAGLGGMPQARRLSEAVTLVRPLLGVHRCVLLEYLDQIGQPYRQDGSNWDRRFTRNRLRHDLLPYLADQYNPAVGDALLRLARLAGEIQEVAVRRVGELKKRAVAAGRRGVLLRRQSLAGEPEYIIRELIKAVWRRQGWPLQCMGFDQWDLLVRLLLSKEMLTGDQGGKRTLPGSVTAEVVEDGLKLERSTSSTNYSAVMPP